jgi:diguanylate cyclase (GGDEF)-like protein
LAWHEPEARELGLLSIDVDEFKSINELYGHAVGDGLLKMIAARLTAAVRKHDWVSRHGDAAMFWAKKHRFGHACYQPVAGQPGPSPGQR